MDFTAIISLLLILIYLNIIATLFDQIWSSSGQPNFKNVYRL